MITVYYSITAIEIYPKYSAVSTTSGDKSIERFNLFTHTYLSQIYHKKFPLLFLIFSHVFFLFHLGKHIKLWKFVQYTSAKESVTPITLYRRRKKHIWIHFFYKTDCLFARSSRGQRAGPKRWQKQLIWYTITKYRNYMLTILLHGTSSGKVVK